MSYLKPAKIRLAVTLFIQCQHYTAMTPIVQHATPRWVAVDTLPGSARLSWWSSHEYQASWSQRLWSNKHIFMIGSGTTEVRTRRLYSTSGQWSSRWCFMLAVTLGLGLFGKPVAWKWADKLCSCCSTQRQRWQQRLKWLWHALPGCMDGTPHPMQTAAHFARRLCLQALTGWLQCQTSPCSPSEVAAARLTRQLIPGSSRLTLRQGLLGCTLSGMSRQYYYFNTHS